MKRKLISQKNSLTLTLPKDWVKKMNLSSKDEVDILQEGEVLFVNSEKKEIETTLSIDVSNYSDQFIRNLLNQSYIDSFTKIVVTSSKKSKLNLCEKLTSLFLVGFHATEKSENKIILEQLSHIKKEDFDKFLLKIFNHLDNSFISIIENKNQKEMINEIKRDTKKVTQYKNLCKRILISEPFSKRESNILFEILGILTEISHLVFHMSQKSLKSRGEIKKINTLFDLVKSAYFRDNLDKINDMQIQFEEVSNKGSFDDLTFSLLRANYNLSNSIISKILLKFAN